MTIRKFCEKDYDRLVEIWLEASIKAHSFIKPSFWKSKELDMKEKYLPKSNTYVLETEEKILGFVSMVDDYLAALFIDVNHQSKGYGKELLEFVKRDHKNINLKTYQQNLDTVLFYLKNDFVILRQLIDEETDEREYVMIWRRHGYD